MFKKLQYLSYVERLREDEAQEDLINVFTCFIDLSNADISKLFTVTGPKSTGTK